ncbi:hypothetical protein D1AOALGA4SA_10419 [Olavius algarvensis Delta 1 endosymbiont]|nr:hypothetical protein D1AOALGA4SA_10419 [Olavius algarvensis Delta 1 endosymbiont]
MPIVSTAKYIAESTRRRLNYILCCALIVFVKTQFNHLLEKMQHKIFITLAACAFDTD